MKQYIDDAIPTSNAIFTAILQQIGFLLGDNQLLLLAEKSLKNAFPHITRAPNAFCSFLSALQYYFQPAQIIIVRGTGNDLDAWRESYLNYRQPNRLAFFINNQESLPSPLSLKIPHNSRVIAYFCIGHNCLSPILNLKEFEHVLKRN